MNGLMRRQIVSTAVFPAAKLCLLPGVFDSQQEHNQRACALFGRCSECARTRGLRLCRRAVFATDALGWSGHRRPARVEINHNAGAAVWQNLATLQHICRRGRHPLLSTLPSLPPPPPKQRKHLHQSEYYQISRRE